ncbi:MAG: squalene synthetase, partial [Olpidium bornovanus]
ETPAGRRLRLFARRATRDNGPARRRAASPGRSAGPAALLPGRAAQKDAPPGSPRRPSCRDFGGGRRRPVAGGHQEVVLAVLVHDLALFRSRDRGPPPGAQRGCLRLLPCAPRSGHRRYARLLPGGAPASRTRGNKLVLRCACRSAEDDVSIPLERKCQVLRDFNKNIYCRGWTFNESQRICSQTARFVRGYRAYERLKLFVFTDRPTEKDAFLLKNFSVVIEEFLKLDRKYQEVIADITKQMGAGMAEFCLENKQGNVTSMEEYNLYCHYVAGIVGIGLSRMFSVSGLESEKLLASEALPNSMGLFLQKTNIIRDFLEDLRDKRCWWPREAWGSYAASLEGLLELEKEQQALAVLNTLCADALSLATSSLEYLSYLRERSLFHFCAIPQVMAVATLALVFNNPDVFRRKGVKIRKGEAVRCINQSQNMHGVLDMFEEKVEVIMSKNWDPNAPSFLKVALTCANIKQTIAEHKAKQPASPRLVSKSRYRILYGLSVIIPLLAAIKYRWP